MVGAGSPDAYMSVLESRFRRNDIRWWDKDIAARVEEAVRQARSAAQPPSPPIAKLSAGDGSYVSMASIRPVEKTRLEQLLHDAIVNTGRA